MVGNDIQFVVDFQVVVGVVEHFLGDVIGQCMLLVKWWVVEYSIKVERFYVGECVVDYKFVVI